MGATAAMMRLRRPRWKDPRLIVGIVLVVASVLMGAVLVSRLSETTTVLVVKSAIVPGDALDDAELTTVELRLGDQTDHYVGDLGAIPEGAVATRAIQSGELLPLSAVGQASDVPLRPVVIPVEAAVAESVVPGATVELWHTAPAGDDGQDAQAGMLVPDAVVRRVDEGSSLGMRSCPWRCSCPVTSSTRCSRCSRRTNGSMSSGCRARTGSRHDRHRALRLGQRRGAHRP